MTAGLGSISGIQITPERASRRLSTRLSTSAASSGVSGWPAQVVLCAGQPDTPELAAEVESLVDSLREARSGVIWIPEMLPKPAVIQLLSHATVFACPSLY